MISRLLYNREQQITRRFNCVGGCFAADAFFRLSQNDRFFPWYDLSCRDLANKRVDRQFHRNERELRRRRDATRHSHQREREGQGERSRVCDSFEQRPHPPVHKNDLSWCPFVRRKRFELDGGSRGDMFGQWESNKSSTREKTSGDVQKASGGARS